MMSSFVLTKSRGSKKENIWGGNTLAVSLCYGEG